MTGGKIKKEKKWLEVTPSLQAEHIKFENSKCRMILQVENSTLDPTGCTTFKTQGLGVGRAML